jgi:excisionase family DNA binding protein
MERLPHHSSSFRCSLGRQKIFSLPSGLFPLDIFALLFQGLRLLYTIWRSIMEMHLKSGLIRRRLLAKEKKMPPNLFAHPIPLLRALYPGSFPDILLRQPETHPERLPGALLTTEEAADYIAVAPETLRRLCRAKAITFIQPTPSEYRFALADLEEYINSRRNKRASGVR